MPNFGFTSRQNENDILAVGPRVVSKVITAAATSFTTAASPVTLFNVGGLVWVRLFGTIETALTSTGTNGTIAIGVSGNTGALIAATTADGTNFPTGAVWAGDTSPTVKSEVLTSVALNGALIYATPIIATIATNSMTAGALTFYCEWRPLSQQAYVIPA